MCNFSSLSAIQKDKGKIDYGQLAVGKAIFSYIPLGFPPQIMVGRYMHIIVDADQVQTAETERYEWYYVIRFVQRWMQMYLYGIWSIFSLLPLHGLKPREKGWDIRRQYG